MYYTKVSKNTRNQLIFVIICFLISLIVSIIYSSYKQEKSEPILIGAAASLQPVLEEINTLYPHPINTTFASSGVIQQQIEQGAPIDIFISASKKQIKSLENKTLILSKYTKNLLTNQLTLIINKNNLLSINNFQDLKDKNIQLIAIGEPRSVPVGEYAIEVFDNLNILPFLNSKLLLSNNVRTVLNHVETGNADAGIVYLTDAINSEKVKIVAIADSKLHSPIIYPVAIIKNSKNIKEAEKYLEFLATEEVLKIFRKYGFGIPQ